MKPFTNSKLPMNRKTIGYGQAGIGKSTWASKAPKPIFIPTEDGVSSLQVDQFPLCKSLTDVKKCIDWLGKEQHKYQTVVLDSADWLESLICADVCAKAGCKVIGDFEWGKGYQRASHGMLMVLDALDALRIDKSMHVIVLAHSKTERHEDPEHPAFDRFTLKLHKTAASLLVEWADEVFFMRLKARTSTVQDGPKTVTKAKPDGRSMVANGRPACIAKNRLGMPDEIPMTWDAYAGYFQSK